MLHEREQWLVDNHADIAAKIEEGYASAERRELLDPVTSGYRFTPQGSGL